MGPSTSLSSLCNPHTSHPQKASQKLDTWYSEGLGKGMEG